LSDVLAGGGILLAAAAAAAAMLLPAGRPRGLAMLAAVVLFPVLILGDQWHTHQIVDLRHDNGRIAALGLVGAAAVAALALIFRRWPILLPLAIVAALPFRVPLTAGGDTANLLVPLYLVITGAVVATLLRDWSAPPAGGMGREAENGATHRPQASLPMTGAAGRARQLLPQILAVVVLLYAVQTLYSEDFSKGLQNVCFFLVPFSIVYALIAEVAWDRRLLKLVLCVVAFEAVAFVAIGTVEYATRSLFWNDQVIRSNEFHTYFRVNSVFWDPNIYGRYLALVMVVATAPLLWVRDRRSFFLLTALLVVLWFGLTQTFSESSFIALLAGLAVLAALRWSWRWTLAATLVGLVGVVLVVLFAGGKSTINLNVLTSGRADLVSGGLDLWTERPLQGYGSGSFQEAYGDHREDKDAPVSISHTEPITVLAEQGLVGFALYLALIAAALWTMGAGMWSRAAERAPPYAGRGAVLAAFVALLVHTMAYAGFYEDPITWVLLATGVSLAAAAGRQESGLPGRLRESGA
jgi:O-antigen ligase